MLALLAWAFSIYGFLAACWHVLNMIVWRRKKIPPVTAILVVHDGAEYIEGLLRTIMGVAPFVRRELRVVVVDCWSDDDTVEIVRRLYLKKRIIRVCRVENDDELFVQYNQLLARGRGIYCTFDLRQSVGPDEVIPALAALWGADARRAVVRS